MSCKHLPKIDFIHKQVTRPLLYGGSHFVMHFGIAAKMMATSLPVVQSPLVTRDFLLVTSLEIIFFEIRIQI